MKGKEQPRAQHVSYAEFSELRNGLLGLGNIFGAIRVTEPREEGEQVRISNALLPFNLIGNGIRLCGKVPKVLDVYYLEEVRLIKPERLLDRVVYGSLHQNHEILQATLYTCESQARVSESRLVEPKNRHILDADDDFSDWRVVGCAMRAVAGCVTTVRINTDSTSEPIMTFNPHDLFAVIKEMKDCRATS